MITQAITPPIALLIPYHQSCASYLGNEHPGLRLPSFSGHPIGTDLVSVGEDVHCEFVKEEVHPGVPA